MKKYREILKNYRLSLIISPLLVLITVVCETIQPMFMARIIDDGVMPKDLSVVTQTGGIMVLVSVVGLVFSVLNVYLSSRTSIGFGTELRNELFGRVQEFSFADIDTFGTGSLVTRLTNDITRIQQIVQMSMRIMLRAPMMLGMAVFFVVRINMQLAMVLLAAVPVLGLSIYLILRKGFPFFLKVQQKVDQLNEVVRENLINIRVVKSFVRERHETERFERSSDDLRDMVIRASNTVVSMFPVMQLVMNFTVVAILWLGGWQVMDGRLKVGELISFVNYVMQVLMSLMMLSMIIMNFARASASSRRVTEVFNSKSTHVDVSERTPERYIIGKGDVVFDNVSFRYAGSDNDVLKNISFHILPGETVAIGGATGSAKTSMVQLIPGLYDATEGEVRIDSVPVGKYNADHLHSSVGMVLQKNELFTGTVAENLRWGKPDATLQELEEACRAAEAHTFITALTEGYDTMLGRGGINLSGGQKQRLCIARALLRKPKILILDDSTSAIDTETELRIRNNLHNILVGTTVFIITQRINTMQSADRVIILDDGQIQAMGTPDELMRTSEVYREIYNSQQIIL